MTTAKPNILIIDDQADIHEVVGDGLSSLYHVDAATDAYIAQQYVSQKKYDLILCDINMPFISGLVLIEEFNRRRLNIPFIFISGHVDNEVSRQALKLGASNILEKPFRLPELRDKVAMALKLREAQDQLAESEEFHNQEMGHVYNMLKSHYYDFERLIHQIQFHNIPMSFVSAELEKKIRSGRCLLDDPDFLTRFDFPMAGSGFNS